MFFEVRIAKMIVSVEPTLSAHTTPVEVSRSVLAALVTSLTETAVFHLQATLLL